MPRLQKLPLDVVLRMLAKEDAVDREAERALTMTDEEVMCALEAEGLTPEWIAAEARAVAERVPALAEKLLAEERKTKAPS